jgi:hypothetical protein
MLSKSLSDIVANAVDAKSRQFGNRTAVADQLKKTSARSSLFLYGAAAMCLILFVVYLCLIVLANQDTTKLAALSTLFGVSLAGLIATMMRLAREQAETGMLLALVAELPQDEVLDAMKALLDHARKMNSKTKKTK